MIYLDSSVALAHIFGEDARPPDRIWDEVLASSLLLQYEVWNRINARGLSGTLRTETEATLERIEFVALSPAVLRRALAPFPLRVRTLDSLHLATAEFLRMMGETVELATYDRRMIEAGTTMGFAIRAL